VKVVYYDTLTLTKKGDEQTALRFSVSGNGDVTDINQRPVSLVQAVRQVKR
jgi:hypothetical protein